ncbi:MAG: hypothetical protein M5U01_14550 [Ardenticatenaceae bacterium]|nr:hypothetical protein [Ardenticatenaceae bacterium]HBY92496.1 hypothetical protein [Chloroflexota bacterium]
MNSPFNYRFQLYNHLQARAPQIYAEAREAARALGIIPEMRGTFGFTGAVSSCHGLLIRRVAEAIEAGARKVIGNAPLDECVRAIVKDVYGDEWDAACINTCEAALWVTFDTFFTPPFTGRGDTYRARYITLYERHLHHHGGYGRPFPPRYKDLFGDRGVTAGELGFSGKRLTNLDAIFVRLSGAEYPTHGIKYHPVPLLTRVDPEAARAALAEVAAHHADTLVGFSSLGYDTPGYGYGVKNQDGAPKLQVLIGELARRYQVPYVVDNAWGAPFLGTDPRAIGADIMVYSMDKAAGAPTAGLIVGREELMVQIRRALGIHGQRWGTGSSHGKAAYVTNDPGKEALLGVIASLEVLRDEPERVTQAVDDLYDIVVETFAELPAPLRQGWMITKSMNSMAVELNYENTWRDGEMGFPIFTIEDMYAGSNIIQNCMSEMGLVPTIGYDGNILLSPGLGTTDEEGQLIEREARMLARALVRVVEIVYRHMGTPQAVSFR